ncbi:MAG: c-type cytochrome domain-containing protein [Opitutaceae bacterium]
MSAHPSRSGRQSSSVRAPTTRLVGRSAGILAGLAGLAMSSMALARDAPRSDEPSDALTLLENHCVKCHGGEKTKANFDLTTRAALLRGGESGLAFSPGQPVETSLLYQMIAHLEEPGMPHKEDMLPVTAIEEIARWLGDGAPYVRALNTSVTDANSHPARLRSITLSSRLKKRTASNLRARRDLSRLVGWVVVRVETPARKR